MRISPVSRVRGPKVGRPSEPASTPIVPSRRYGTVDPLIARRAMSASSGRSEKLTVRSMGISVCCRAARGRPRGRSRVAARGQSRERPLSSRSDPVSVDRVRPNGFGFSTRAHRRTPAPPRGPDPEPSKRSSAGLSGTVVKRGGWTRAAKPPSVAQPAAPAPAMTAASHGRSWRETVLIAATGVQVACRVEAARLTCRPVTQVECSGHQPNFRGSCMPSARIERATLIVLAVLSVVLLAMVIYPFASALFVAAVLAAALMPWTERLAALLRGRRQIAAGVLTLGTLLLLVVPIAAVGLSLGKEAVAGIGYVKETLSGEGVAGLINDLPAPLRTLVEKVLEQIPGGEERIQELTDTQGGRAAAALGGVLGATTQAIVQVVMMLIALFFLLTDGR